MRVDAKFIVGEVEKILSSVIITVKKDAKVYTKFYVNRTNYSTILDVVL